MVSSPVNANTLTKIPNNRDLQRIESLGFSYKCVEEHPIRSVPKAIRGNGQTCQNANEF